MYIVQFRVTNEEVKLIKSKGTSAQGYNARKVISEVYASFVLQCTVSGR